MSLRSGNIPSLVQGVSQQPAALRLPTQLDLQENCHSSVVEGLIRRPPTEHIAKVSDSAITDAFHHTINRDLTERYNVIATTSGIQVFDLDGVAKTVNYVDTDVVMAYDKAATHTSATYRISAAPGETAIDFTVSGITTATVKLQLSADDVNWSDADTRTTDGTTTGISISSNLYMRVNISAYTSGSITAKATYKNVRYLYCDSPKSELRAATIADFTFLVNSTKTVTMKKAVATKSPTRNPEALIFVRAGNYGSNYLVYVNSVQKASYTTSTTDVTDISTNNIALELYNDLVAAGFNTGGWSVSIAGSVVYLTNVQGTDFNVQVYDSQGGSSLKVFKDLTTTFTDLPVKAVDGFQIGVDANPDTLAGQYFLKATGMQAGGTFVDCSWQETVAKGLEISFDENTMPHSLIREADGTFTFEPVAWADRVVGDDTTNSLPSFVDTTIEDVFFYKNRLGFLADEFFVLSETGEYFNFWRTTVTQLLDTDPIDSRAVHTKVSILKHAVPFNTDLILFSDQTQFKIPGDVALTPKTVRCDPAAEFEGNLTTKPVNVGKSLYFVFNREGYAGLKDLYLSESVVNQMDATDLTGHVPAYIPSGVFSMTASTVAEVAVLLTDGDPSAAYVYKTAFKPGTTQKIQEAWYRWPMGDEDTTVVLSARFIESILYLLVQRDSKVYLEKMILQPSRVDTGSTYVTHLDRRFDQSILTVAEVGPSYDIETNTTLFPNLPYPPDDNTVITTKAGQVLQIEDSDADSLSVLGDYSEATVWIGQKYTSRARTSTIYVRKQTLTGGMTIDEAGRLQLLRGYLNYANTGYFKVSVTPEGRDTSDSIFTGQVVGDVELGIISLQSGRFSFGILSKNDRVIIEISSDSILPFSLSSMEWEGNYVKRSGG